jgi:EF hand
MRNITILCALLASVATPALAQRGGEWFGPADANGDGAVTRAEFLSYRDANFGKLDRNGDGVVSPADFPRLAKRKPEALERLMGMLGNADSNGDGAVSRVELAKSPPMMFDRVDANHDGRVTRTEYDDARARMRAAAERQRN